MPLVERRYAEALVEISAQSGAIDAYQNEFRSVAEIFETESDFKLFLLNPKINTDVKKSVVSSLFLGKVRTELLNFLMLLLDKGRIKFLPGILTEFIRLADKRRNVLNLTIISAIPLEDAQINQLKVKYAKMYSASKINMDVQIDKSLIGGLKVRVGDNVIDGTVKGRLESLREVLMG